MSIVRVGRRRIAGALLGLAAASIVGGCSLLYGLDPNMPPDFGMPQPVAVYRDGRATIKVGSDPLIVLDTLSDTGSYDPSFGAGATFHNADGWYVRVMGASKLGGFMSSPAYVSVERIAGTEHWVAGDPNRCVVTISAADATGLLGTATCKGLRWADSFGSSGLNYEPPYIDDQPAFDAEITFEARPSPTQVG